MYAGCGEDFFIPEWVKCSLAAFLDMSLPAPCEAEFRENGSPSLACGSIRIRPCAQASLMYPEPEKVTQTRFADKLVKVFNRQGHEEWLLCHVEIQGETKKEERRLFAKRMVRYWIRIWDRYQKPVSAVAIFTGADGGKMPDRFEYEYRKTRLLYEYHTLSILGFSRSKIRAIFVFLENVVPFEDPQMNRIFRRRIQSQDKNNIMGIDEYVKMVAKEEARENYSWLFVENLLKGSDFSAEKIASLANVTVEFVNKIKNGLEDK